jgi:polysaccharide biosynthesis/export protein
MVSGLVPMRLGVIALLLAVSACGHRAPIGSTGVVSAYNGAELPEPTRDDLVEAPRDFVVGAFDVLTIGVFGVDEFQPRQIRISGNGSLSFPLAGEFQVAGMTTQEVAAVLAQRLKAGGIRDPQVSVNVFENNSQLYTVSGQVGQPGNYPAMGNTSLVRAVASARGLTEFADGDDVVVFRTVSGQKLAAMYSLQAIERGNYADPKIFPNDIIVVADDKSRRLFRDLLQVVPLITTPLIVLLRK